MGWYGVEADDSPAIEYRRCPDCSNVWDHSGLMDHERGLSLDSITEVAPAHTVLKVAGQTILENRRGFVGIYGSTGSAKSEWGKILVSSFCRQGIPSRYTTGHRIEQALFGEDETDDGRKRRTINGGALDIYKRAQVLVIDELQRVNWKSEWISGHICDLLDARYRAAGEANSSQRQVTVLIAQYPFADFAPDNLISRLRDGRFSVPWPQDVEPVKGYVDEYGLVTWPVSIDAVDFRSLLPSDMRPTSRAALMHPGTGEVLEAY